MAERRDRGVWTRTRSQWVRSVLVTGAVAGGAASAVACTGVLLLSVTLRFIGPYLGGAVTGPTYGGALTLGACVGLTAAGLWGWIGRPRLLPADPERASGDTSGARFWTGADSDADDGTSRAGAVI